MLAMDSAQLALLASDAAGVIFLVDLEFTSGTYCFSTHNVTLTLDGKTYIATGNLSTVGEIQESQETDAQTLTLGLSIANQALLAACMGNVEGYRGRQARVYMQLLDRAHRPVGSPKLRFAGEMEPVKVPRDKPPQEGGNVGGRIELPISRAGMSRARNSEGLRLTDEQQKAEFPGDRGLEYVRPLIERPAQWLSKRFQEQ
ncbi:hypothetical protein WDZ92_37300 [Nostoc sp. NIES-2111]